MARRRHLRPEEEDLWLAVARTAQPMHAKAPHGQRPGGAVDLPPSLSKERVLPAQPALETFRVGEKARTVLGHDLLPSVSARLSLAPLRMDAKAFALDAPYYIHAAFRGMAHIGRRIAPGQIHIERIDAFSSLGAAT